MAKRRRGETLPLFPEEDGTASGARAPGEPAGAPGPYALANGERLRRWASRGICFGTSSWKYPGWKGLVYTGGYSSQKSFERDCLAEYSTIFPTVCADFAFYDFPDPGRMKAIHDQTTGDFTLSLKVTDRITIKHYPDLPRHGAQAGKENPDFLNAELFEDAFLAPLAELRKKVGVIIFEFSAFTPGSGVTGGRFVELLDRFLAKLPKRSAYAVEIRNREFLTEEYLALLRAHGVSHVLSSWTRMPPILEQVRVGGILTAPFSVARALLRTGRTYQEAVERFAPYDAIKEENPELRTGLVELVRHCIAEGKTLYAYINNRAEGNSPKTIEAILDILDSYPVEKL
jgi:uncharacterized protein YecE (DUF72 family)